MQSGMVLKRAAMTAAFVAEEIIAKAIYSRIKA